MLNFQVPQFIEVEDKIFGPLSFKQFVYVVGGAGASFMFWVYMPYRWLAFLFIAPTMGVALALAFYKVNNRSFVLIMEAAFRYLWSHKLYLWKHGPSETAVNANRAINAIGQGASDQPKGLNVPKLSESRLKDLSWSLDVREKIK